MLQDTLAQLAALGSAEVKARNIRTGSDTPQFGVKLGDIRSLAKKLKVNHALGLDLWHSGNMDAQLLGILLLKPALLETNQLEQMVRGATVTQVADWLNSYVVKQHPEKERLRLAWLDADDPMLQRSGWSLTNERISKTPEGLDLAALLDRIEAELPDAPAPAQWTMNMCLAAIGINDANLRQRALDIGESIGIYRYYPTPKGCTSPFAPLWINEIVRRAG